MADGRRYAEYCEQLSRLDASDHASALQRILGPAAAETLEHVHETSQWFAGLLANFAPDFEGMSQLAAPVVWLCAKETWTQDLDTSESHAEATVRSFQSAVFQSNEQVSKNIARWRAGEEIKSTYVPGGHFAMLHSPHVTSTALRLCHAIVE